MGKAAKRKQRRRRTLEYTNHLIDELYSWFENQYFYLGKGALLYTNLDEFDHLDLCELDNKENGKFTYVNQDWIENEIKGLELSIISNSSDTDLEFKNFLIKIKTFYEEEVIPLLFSYDPESEGIWIEIKNSISSSKVLILPFDKYKLFPIDKLNLIRSMLENDESNDSSSTQIESLFQKKSIHNIPQEVNLIWAIIPTKEEPGENIGMPIFENNYFIFWSEDYNKVANYESTHKNCFMLPMVRSEEYPDLWRAATRKDFSLGL